MDTNTIHKVTVKDRLLNALVSLIKDDIWSNITITRLIKEAGVARASFYRNFTSIEDVVFYGIDQTITHFREASQKLNGYLTDPDFIQFSFAFYQRNIEIILAFHRSQFSHSLLEVMNDFTIETYGDMPAHSIERYVLYFHTGAFHNMAITWLEAGCPETAEEMTQVYLGLIGKIL